MGDNKTEGENKKGADGRVYRRSGLAPKRVGSAPGNAVAPGIVGWLRAWHC